MARMYGKRIYSVITVLGIQIFRVVFGHHCRAGTMSIMFFKEYLFREGFKKDEKNGWIYPTLI